MGRAGAAGVRRQIDDIPLKRGIRAGLIGHTERVLWTVANDGWIFEARETNRETAQFHGYPVLPEESIGRLVFDRFANSGRKSASSHNVPSSGRH